MRSALTLILALSLPLAACGSDGTQSQEPGLALVPGPYTVTLLGTGVQTWIVGQEGTIRLPSGALWSQDAGVVRDDDGHAVELDLELRTSTLFGGRYHRTDPDGETQSWKLEGCRYD